jgi:hypothetical protein
MVRCSDFLGFGHWVAEYGEEASLDNVLQEELHSFTGEGWEQEDDITLLTLRRLIARS